MIDVLGSKKRRRRSAEEKIAIVQQSFEPGMSVSGGPISMALLPVSSSCGVNSIRRQPDSRCRRRTGCARVGAGICVEAN